MRLQKPPRDILLWLLAATLLAAPLSRAAVTLRPVGDVETIPIGRAAKPYLVVGSDPVVIPIIGPGTITYYARVPMPTDVTYNRSGILTFGGLGTASEKVPLQFRPSRSGSWADGSPGAPSSGTKSTLDIPAGEHRLSLTAEVVGGDPILLILYYDGPEQPEVPGLAPVFVPVQMQAATPKKKKSSWSFRGNAGLDVLYNDNILANSPDDIGAFTTGSYPYKFANDSIDDLVVSPSVSLETRGGLVDWGQTRFTLKIKRFMYTHNPIKTNTDFHFHLRQFFGKRQSLEVYFHFAPEQYIKELSDRSPLDDPDDDINWTEFRFQRNVWNLTWRQTVSKTLALKAIYERNYRYYNQPFMENDIEAWEVRLNAGIKLSRTVSLSLDYSYEDAQGRGLDEVGEDILTSDNSDPSYERDLYRLGMAFKPKAWRKVINQLDFSFLFMDYYYTTLKSLVQDPYHSGRRDTYYKATVEARRRLSRTVTLKAAVRRTERVVYSPWEGDITTDKDFTQWMYWVNCTYRF